MLTRCPACATTFRLTAEQIKLRAGRVRCGKCQHAFNALDTLIDEFTDGIPPTATESPETISEPAATELAVSSAPTFDDTEEYPPLATAATPTTPEEEDEKATTVTQDILLDEISQWPKPTVTVTPRRWPWLVGSLLLLMTLSVQAAIALRVEIAILAPAARPVLVSLCNIAGCTVDLPAKAELIGIESSDLHPDPAQPGRLLVAATLKNRAPFSQQFPHLELTLTDIADKAIVRKVLTPADYLPPKTPTTNGMRPNADIAVNLTVDIGQLSANGYRLYLFYP